MTSFSPSRPVLVLRHGESTANVAGLIASSPGPRTLHEVGLTELGREQARAAALTAREHGLGEDAMVVSSDFARARQTAEEFAQALGARPPRFDARLRERDFGALDGGSSTEYGAVWEVDAARGEHAGGIEPVLRVAARAAQVLAEADEAARRQAVVLVGHGDVLQILLALADGRDPHDHRDQPPLRNGKLRALGPHRPDRPAPRSGGADEHP